MLAAVSIDGRCVALGAVRGAALGVAVALELLLGCRRLRRTRPMRSVLALVANRSTALSTAEFEPPFRRALEEALGSR